jgi:hypothetical protein
MRTISIGLRRYGVLPTERISWAPMAHKSDGDALGIKLGSAEGLLVGVKLGRLLGSEVGDVLGDTFGM